VRYHLTDIRIDNYIKIGSTLLLLILLFKKIDLLDVLETILSLHVGYFLTSLVFVPLMYLIRTERWNVLLSSIEIRKSFSILFRAMIIGVFYGLVTPGKVGELWRARALNEKNIEVIPTIMIEKIIDILILIILCFFTIFKFFDEYPRFKYMLFISAVLFLIGFWLLIDRRVINAVVNIFKLNKSYKEAYLNTLSKLIKDKNSMIITTMLGICYYLLAYISAYYLLRSLNVSTYMVVTLPLIVLMGNLPITISGFGLRESLGAVCFVLLGESGALGVSFSLLVFITVTLLPGLIGYLMVVTMNSNKCYNKGQITGLLSPILERIRLDEIRNHIDSNRNRILDFGCGYGKLAFGLLYEEYVGVDIDKNVIDSAKDIHKGNNNAKFIYLDEFKNVTTRFDIIILAAVVEHVDDPTRFIAELKEHLQDDGKIIITTPTSLANRILLIGSKFRLFSKEGVREHKSLLGKRDFIEIASRTSLRLVMYRRFELGLNQLIVYKFDSVSYNGRILDG
jgi:glycosyltransferase 2 family protein